MADPAPPAPLTFQRGFYPSPRLRVDVDDGRNIILVKRFFYTAQDGTVVEVLPGVLSDGASTPRSLWPVIPPFGKYWPGAVLHDALYRYCADATKKFCDDCLLDAMQVLQVPGEEARAIYEAVVLGGQLSFDKDRALLHQSPSREPLVIIHPPGTFNVGTSDAVS